MSDYYTLRFRLGQEWDKHAHAATYLAAVCRPAHPRIDHGPDRIVTTAMGDSQHTHILLD
jgi:hypothetical protein